MKKWPVFTKTENQNYFHYEKLGNNWLLVVFYFFFQIELIKTNGAINISFFQRKTCYNYSDMLWICSQMDLLQSKQRWLNLHFLTNREESFQDLMKRYSILYYRILNEY